MMTKKFHFINKYNITALVTGGFLLLLYGITLIAYVTEDYISLAQGVFDKPLLIKHVLAVVTAFCIFISPLHRRILGLVAMVLSLIVMVATMYTGRHLWGDLTLSFFVSLFFLIPSAYIFLSTRTSAVLETQDARARSLFIGIILVIVMGLLFTLGIRSH